MPVTMKEIADLAGVSVGTVDRALNKRGRVRADVAERICAIAERLNYRTNSVAKSLAMRNKNLKIAVVLHIGSNSFYNHVMVGIHQAAEEIRDFGVQVELYHCRDFDATDQAAKIDQAIADGADGIILVPISAPIIRERISSILSRQLPLLFLSSLLMDMPDVPSVHCDYLQSGRLGGRLVNLISGGSNHFLVFMPNLAMFGHQQRIQGIQEYVEGADSGMKIEEVVVCPNDSIGTYRTVLEALHRFDHVSYSLFCGDTEAYLQAVKDCNRSMQTIVYDEPQDMKHRMESGKIAAAILQEPTMQGYRAVMAMFHRLINNQPLVDTVIDNKIVLLENA